MIQVNTKLSWRSSSSVDAKLSSVDAVKFGEGSAEAATDEVAKVEPIDVDDNEDKYADDMEMPGTKVDSKQRINVRNLRIREYTAKYLLNLDLSSAYYDPKTRSMRENPFKDTLVIAETFTGENAVRFSGETNRVAKAQLFPWDAYEKGVDLHLQADLTKAKLLQKQYEEKKGEFKQNIEKDILER